MTPPNPINRIDSCFAALKQQQRTAFVSFITAGDPDYTTSLELLKALPKAGVDMIELGMPFTDPMADGVAIQAANLRAIASGMTLARLLTMVQDFRKGNTTTPIILMGYYNMIYSMGVAKFVARAVEAGVDGTIIVDLPPEESAEFLEPAQAAGLHSIRLATPTTDAARLPAVLDKAGGFVYYVSLNGITGTNMVDVAKVEQALRPIRAKTTLPLAVGFGIRDPATAAAIAKIADAVVVGSAIVQKVGALKAANAPAPALVHAVAAYVQALADAVHEARQDRKSFC